MRAKLHILSLFTKLSRIFSKKSHGNSNFAQPNIKPLLLFMKHTIAKRLAGLRQFMQSQRIEAFVVPTTDPHSGEYTPAHWECRKWISGFTGSAGTAVITSGRCGLWTDSRYFLQAEEQLKGTEYALFKERQPETPGIAEWLGAVLRPGDKVGIDGMANSAGDAERLQAALRRYGLELVMVPDPFDSLWDNRPSIPLNRPFILPERFSGEPCKEKLAKIRQYLHDNQADGILLSALDEIAWTLNLRGNDVHCNPVFVSYLLVTENEAVLFILPEKLDKEVAEYLEANNIRTEDYRATADALARYGGRCLWLPETTNYLLFQTASKHANVVRKPSPALYLKAVKNATEIAGFRAAMERDGAAMVRFLMWLKKAVKSGKETELTVSRKLYELRAQQDLFKGISFDTIAGYQEHGAIVHYEADEETASALKPEGLLLIDSGAQYLDGTTDITRTVALGPVTDEQKKDYTLVLKGFIALSSAEFPHGTCGTQLDVLARQFAWKEGVNYGHGTGHGVGHFLNVHEGPHQIRMNNVPAPLLPGMTVTNEPGIYKAGRYGIRTENTMLVVESRRTEFGTFYKFEPLTLCPIDKEAVCIEMLDEKEKQWLDNYHAHVYKRLCPLLDEAERAWLEEAVSPVGSFRQES